MKILFPRPNIEKLRMTISDYEYNEANTFLNVYPTATTPINSVTDQTGSQQDITHCLNRILIIFFVFALFLTVIWSFAMYTILVYLYNNIHSGSF